MKPLPADRNLSSLPSKGELLTPSSPGPGWLLSCFYISCEQNTTHVPSAISGGGTGCAAAANPSTATLIHPVCSQFCNSTTAIPPPCPKLTPAVAVCGHPVSNLGPQAALAAGALPRNTEAAPSKVTLVVTAQERLSCVTQLWL